VQPDEVVEQFSLDWDSKRDRWNGYDPNDYAKQFEGPGSAARGGKGPRCARRAHLTLG